MFDTATGWVHNDHMDNYCFVDSESCYVHCDDVVRCSGSDEYYLTSDCTECVESNEYYSDTDAYGTITNRGFVSENHLDDYVDCDGEMVHTDDTEDAGYVYATDTDEYIKKSDSYVCNESGDIVAQPLFA